MQIVLINLTSHDARWRAASMPVLDDRIARTDVRRSPATRSRARSEARSTTRRRTPATTTSLWVPARSAAMPASFSAGAIFSRAASGRWRCSRTTSRWPTARVCSW